MKAYNTDQIRNIVLVGNAGSGKTALSEAMVFNGGLIDRRGDASTRNTISDFKEIEQQNGSSVFSSLLYTEFENCKINILDAPGLDDFIGGVISSLYVSELAVMLINAQNGIEVGSEIHYRYIKRDKKPLLLAINHLDNEKANWEKTIESIKNLFGTNAVLFQFPVEIGNSFKSIVDILKMKLLVYKSDDGKAEIQDIPANLKEQAQTLYNQLIEKAAENDEALMEKFFESETLTEDEIKSGIKKGIINGSLIPIFCISAKKNIGVTRLMEFICNIGPSPIEVTPPSTEDGKVLNYDKSAEPSMFVFKTSYEQHVGEIIYFKVMSGEIKEGMDVVNSHTRNKERLGQLFITQGKNRIKTGSFIAGDLGTTVKLKGTKVNHTLSISGEIKFPPIQFPEPKFRIAVKALNEADEEKLGEALQRMRDEDPTLIVEYSKELKQIIVHGQGEYHLNILKWHLDNVYKIPCELVKPRIPYRETITKAAQADYRHKKQSGGAGQFGEVHMIIEPYSEGMPEPDTYKIDGKEYKVTVRGKEEYELPWGGKLIFYNCIVGGAIDSRFMPSILKGVMEKMEEGPLTGSYARDIRVIVYDGKMHPVDSNDISFRLAGRNAFSLAFKKAAPKILEPIYEVEVLVPSDRMGDVISDLQTRRAVVMGMSSEMGFEKITAKVPLAEMDRYSTALSSITGGRAMYTMRFLEYAYVPAEIQEQLLKEYEAQQKEE